MADQDFPSLPVRADSYSVEWRFEDRWVDGVLNLAGQSMPTGELFGEPSSLVGGPVRSFPQHIDLGELHGRSRSGLDVVLGDASLEVWTPGRSVIRSAWALVGLGIRSVEESRYSHLSMQATGLEKFFGFNPIANIQFPANQTQEQRYSCVVNEHAIDGSSVDDVTVDCSYDQRFAGFDGFGFDLQFAPVVRFTSVAALSVRQWIDQWVTPLRGLVQVSVGGQQRLSWITLHTREPDPYRDGETRTRTSQLFGVGIEQEPFAARRPEYEHDVLIRPLSVSRVPSSLASLVKSWRELQQLDDAFIELYGRDALRQDLPPRSRFLNLMQALEALHATLNQTDDARRQERYEQERTQALQKLAASNLDEDTKRFLRKLLPTRRLDNFERRLRDLLSAVPQRIAGSSDLSGV